LAASSWAGQARQKAIDWGLIVVYAARNAAGDAATLTFTRVRLNPDREVDQTRQYVGPMRF
jgi:hypothetical protein